MFFKNEDIREEKDWEKEWKDMPEFVHNDLRPLRTLFVHFKDEQDIKEFSKIINQKITSQTKFIWYPKEDARKLMNYRYIDSEEEEN